MDPGNIISAESLEFLNAYSIPAGVINAEGQWLFKNSALRKQLAAIDQDSFFELLDNRVQEAAIKKLITRNKRVKLVEAKLVADITNLIAYSVRIQLPNFDHPIYLIEFHPREECFQAFATLNRLYQIQSRHEKESLATNMLLQRAVSESRIDPLTKITNRRALDEHLIAVWEQAFHCSLPFSFLMLDLDFFKKINDLFGHAQGDFVLVKVAETLTKNLNRTGDVVARFGGEEFSAILPNTDIVGAKHISNKLLFAVQHLKIPNPGSDISEHVTVSVGGYTMKPTKREADLSSVIRYADRALYRAKANGRNCAVHYGVFSALS